EPELPRETAGLVPLPARDLGDELRHFRLRERGRPGRVLLGMIVEQLGDDATVLRPFGSRI
ncbi:MAG TPA: hypothetical protein VIZ61_04770, partial [Solirubrobacterales bacterium]